MDAAETSSKPDGQGAATPEHSRHALDALSFFIADAQTGFGPFVAGYLTGRGWSSAEIGTVLSVGTLAALVSQLPGGALVDRLHDKRLGAAAAWSALAAAAVMFAVAPSVWFITIAEVLHSCATSMLSPAIAAISLAIVGRKALGERLGRNARFAAIGNAGTAAALGAAGAWIGPRSVFWLTALFVVPGVLLLFRLPHPRHGPGEPDPPERKAKKSDWRAWLQDIKTVFTHKGVLAFSICVGLFHLSNAALLPLASTVLTETAGLRAPLFISACVIGPQLVVALLSPWIGRTEQRRGVRLILAAGFTALPLRAVLLALVTGLGDGWAPYGIVLAQVLDGVSAAVFGVSLPIVAADLMRGTNSFNLCLGLFGTAIMIGATLSTTLAGHAADQWGIPAADLILAVCGAAAVAAVLLAVRGEAGGGEGASGSGRADA